MKICIITLGCKTNQYESQALGEMLEQNGHKVVYTFETAEIYILNSCAVTNEAERKSRQMISKFNKLNPKCKIFVCGCASQNNAEQFSALENVKYVMGNAKILSLVDKLDKKGKKVEKLPDYYENIGITKLTNTRCNVKIQDGCNRYCSYCLIPYLRGKSRSRDIISILKEVDTLVKKGSKEIILTGIDISDYRIDDKPALLELLEQLDTFNVRYRLGSVEPTLLTVEFVKELAKLKNLCPHFHISMQSGSTSVLKRMNRDYTAELFCKNVKILRKYLGKNIAITTDLIVGFPGETNSEFLQTIKTIKKVKFAQIHIFPYSRRNGTTADKLLTLKSNKEFFIIDGNIVKKRSQTLHELAKKLELLYLKKQKNKVLNVIIEEKQDEFFVGTTENYVKVYVKSETDIINNLLPVKIINLYEDGVWGEVQLVP